MCIRDRTYAVNMPKGTIHTCIIDPGVGAGRRGIVIETFRGDIFIGPDTGFMIPAAEDLRIKSVYMIDESRLPKRISETFHGRDVFAHIAGRIISGTPLDEIGPRIGDYRRISLPKPSIRDGWIEATIMHIDRFGNLITNLPPDILRGAKKVLVKLRDEEIECSFVKAYGLVRAGEPLLTIGGTGFIELSINRGSATERFKLKVGDKILLRKCL